MQTPTTASVLPGVFALIRLSVSFYKKNAKQLFLVGLVPLIIPILNILSSLIIQGQVRVGAATIIFGIISFILAICGIVLQIVSPFAFIKSIQEADAGNQITLKETYVSVFKLFWAIVWLSILSFLVIITGGIFLIIPAVALIVYIACSTYILIVENKRGLSALTHSFYYVQGSWWKVFWRMIALGFIMLLIGAVIAAILVGLYLLSGGSFSGTAFESLAGSLASHSGIVYIAVLVFNLVGNVVYWCVLYPILMLYSYFIYKHLRAGKKEPDELADLKTPRSWFKGLAIFGIIVFIFMIVAPLTLGIIGGYNHAKQVAEQGGNYSGIQSSGNSFFPTSASSLTKVDETLLDNQRYVDKKFGFSIRAPKGWMTPGDEDGVMINPSGIYPEASALVQTTDLSLNALKMTYDAISEEILGQMASKTNLKDLKFGKYKIAGQEINAISGIYKDSMGYASYAEFYIIVDSLKAYTIAVRSSEKDWAVAEPLIHSSISTFEIVK